MELWEQQNIIIAKRDTNFINVFVKLLLLL